MFRVSRFPSRSGSSPRWSEAGSDFASPICDVDRARTKSCSTAPRPAKATGVLSEFCEFGDPIRAPDSDSSETPGASRRRQHGPRATTRSATNPDPVSVSDVAHCECSVTGSLCEWAIPRPVLVCLRWPDSWSFDVCRSHARLCPNRVRSAGELKRAPSRCVLRAQESWP